MQVKNGESEFGWGAVVNFQKKENTRENPMNAVPTYVVDVLIHVKVHVASEGVLNL
jgi:ATP-dependent RNA helicase DOB1